VAQLSSSQCANTFLFILQGSELADLGYGGRFYGTLAQWISVSNSKRIIKIGRYLSKLCSNKNGSSFLTHSVYTPWAIKKHATQYSFITLTNADQFFKILSMLDSAVNLSRDLCYMSNHTYNVSLHYFVKNVIKNS